MVGSEKELSGLVVIAGQRSEAEQVQRLRDGDVLRAADSDLIDPGVEVLHATADQPLQQPPPQAEGAAHVIGSVVDRLHLEVGILDAADQREVARCVWIHCLRRL